MVVGREPECRNRTLLWHTGIRRCRESRVPSIRFPTEGNFEIGNGDIGFRDKRLHGGETVGVVVDFSVTGRIDLRLMLHEVSGEEQRNLF